MAKLTGPLAGFDLRGVWGPDLDFRKIGPQQIVQSRGRSPKPPTPAMIQARNLFAYASQTWARADDTLRAPWHSLARQRNTTAPAEWAAMFARTLKGQSNNLNLTPSTPTYGGIPPLSVGRTKNYPTLIINFTLPPPPTGWTLIALNGVIMYLQNLDPPYFPQSRSTRNTFWPSLTAAIDFTAPGIFIPWGWLEWKRPDNRTAYSLALRGGLFAWP